MKDINSFANALHGDVGEGERLLVAAGFDKTLLERLKHDPKIADAMVDAGFAAEGSQHLAGVIPYPERQLERMRDLRTLNNWHFDQGEFRRVINEMPAAPTSLSRVPVLVSNRGSSLIYGIGELLRARGASMPLIMEDWTDGFETDVCQRQLSWQFLDLEAIWHLTPMQAAEHVDSNCRLAGYSVIALLLMSPRLVTKIHRGLFPELWIGGLTVETASGKNTLYFPSLVSRDRGPVLLTVDETKPHSFARSQLKLKRSWTVPLLVP